MSTAVAPKARVRPTGRPHSPARPPLEVLQRRVAKARSHRSMSRATAVWVAVAMIVGSLFLVVMGNLYLAEGQVRLATVQSEDASLQQSVSNQQVSYALKMDPSSVRSIAESSYGMVQPSTITEIPDVALNVPLPAPVMYAAPAAPVKAGQ